MSAKLDQAIRIANAALIDCGLPPVVYAFRRSIAWDPNLDEGLRLAAYRAAVLAIAAFKGEEHRTSCSECVRGPLRGTDAARCVTVAEALRGVRCGRES